jgi:DNA repair protein RadC
MSISLFYFMEPYEQKLAIKMWAEEDRPREKLLLKGRRQLTDAEIIAILIGSGSKNESAVDLSKRIMATYKNDLDLLGRASVTELSKFKGIGEAKAISIVAALELGRRRKEIPSPDLFRIGCSRDSYDTLYPIFADLNHEEFWVLFLNRGNFVTGKHQISKGGLSGTVADPKIIFKLALEERAAYIVLAHNHPSGNLKPSAEDITLTKKYVESGRSLDLPVVDHLIFADKRYLSFADEGLM